MIARRLLTLYLLLLGIWSWSAAAAVHPALWQADNGKQQLLLLGSIHAADKSFYPLPAPIYQALRNADALIEEIDQQQMEPQTLHQTLAKYGVLEQGQPLVQRVPFPLAQRIIRYAKRYEIDVKNWPNLRNWLINIQLVQGSMHALGLDGQQGIDLHMAAKAKEWDKPIIGLETADQQFAMISKMDQIPAAELFGSTLDEIDEAASYTQKITDAWKQGDSQRLRAIYLDSLNKADSQLIERELLNDRNDNWVKKLPTLPYTNLLVVVGDMHLHGPNSLLDKLQHAGYDVSRYQY